MHRSLIRSLEIEPLDIPLHVPFGISGGAQAIAHNVLATVELSDGTRGCGEAAPLPPYNGETQAQAIAALERGRARIIGQSVEDWRQLAWKFQERDEPFSGAAQCAFETAVLDARARQRAEPLWRFFGGAGSTLETDMTVTTGSPADARESAQAIRARGIRMIKVKIGGKAGAAHDLARILAIREVAAEAPLILDGNAGVSRDHARELAGGLKAHRIVPALLEQWLAKDDLAGMRALREETGWLVAADESVTSGGDATRIADARAADFLNIKLMKAGIDAALDIVGVARTRGLGLMIGGNVESILAMTTSACFAAGLGGFRFADLDTPLFLAENPFEGGYALDGGTISVAHIQAGHGVVPARRD